MINITFYKIYIFPYSLPFENLIALTPHNDFHYRDSFFLNKTKTDAVILVLSLFI